MGSNASDPLRPSTMAEIRKKLGAFDRKEENSMSVDEIFQKLLTGRLRGPVPSHDWGGAVQKD